VDETHARPSPWGGGIGVHPSQLLFAAACASAVLVPLLMFEWRHLPMPVDLAVYRQAGYKILHQVGDLYARGIDNAAFSRTLGPSYWNPRPFTYPPFAALAFAPLTLVGRHGDTIAWTALSMMLLTWVTAVAFSPLLARVQMQRWLALAALIVLVGLSTPVFETLLYGQISLVLAALCLFDCMYSRRRRGMLVGLATALKLLPGLFIVYFAVTRQWKAALRASLTTLACFAVAAIFAPHASLHYFTQVELDFHRAGGVTYFSNQSLNGALHRLGWPSWLWAPVAVPLGVFGLWRARIAHQNCSERAAVALVGLTILLISPISWEAHGVWVVFAVGVITNNGRDPRRLAAAGFVGLLFLLRVPQWGAHLVTQGELWALSGVIEDGFLLGYLVLLVALPTSPPDPIQAAPEAKPA